MESIKTYSLVYHNTLQYPYDIVAYINYLYSQMLSNEGFFNEQEIY